MIEFVRALELVKQKYPELNVSKAGRISTGWVISFEGKDGKKMQISPIHVSKSDGEISPFFPPDHTDDLENYVEEQI